MKKLLVSCITLFAMMMAFGQDDNARFAFISEQTQKWGFMDRNGNVVIEPQFEEIHFGQPYTFPFVEGMAAVMVNSKWGFIDTNGNMMIQPQFEMVSDFEDGIVGGIDTEENLSFFDKTGKTIGYDDVLKTYSFKVEVQYVDGKYVFINKNGEVLAEYDDCCPISEGLARVTRGGYSLYEAQVEGAVSGYIDETGKVVIPLQFGCPSNDFHEGLASVSCHMGNDVWEMGFIDKTGRFAIEPRYKWAGDFQEGLAPVEVDGKWGFIDKTGEMVITPQFYAVDAFSDGLAVFEDFERKQGFIDKSGKIVLGPYDMVLISFKDGLALVVEGGDSYYIDKTGKRIMSSIH